MEIANSGIPFEELKLTYQLSEEDVEDMKQMSLNKQFEIISYGGDRGPGYIGDFAPVLVMHEKKKESVKLQNKEVNERFAEALRELI